MDNDLDFIDTLICSCGSADGLADAAKEIAYQIRVRPNEQTDDLKKAYKTVRNWVMRLAGIPDEYESLVDHLLKEGV